MIEITITTKAGKFKMTGAENIERYEKHLRRRGYGEMDIMAYCSAMKRYYSTYEEEPKHNCKDPESCWASKYARP